MDMFWHECERRLGGVSVGELVRRETPSQVFRWHFGPEHGVELPPPQRYGYRPVALPEEDRRV